MGNVRFSFWNGSAEPRFAGFPEDALVCRRIAPYRIGASCRLPRFFQATWRPAGDSQQFDFRLFYRFAHHPSAEIRSASGVLGIGVPDCPGAENLGSLPNTAFCGVYTTLLGTITPCQFPITGVNTPWQRKAISSMTFENMLIITQA